MNKLQGIYMYNLIDDIYLVKLKRSICRNFEKQQIYTFFYINYYVVAQFLVSILENVGIHKLYIFYYYCDIKMYMC